MTDRASRIPAAPDKLGIFVSSTIIECAQERAAAKRAIVSINHRAILFEGAGARPHPPRRVYLGLLQEVQIFVGIYRASYGWTAPGMSISGLEDEFQTATTSGMPRLVYVSSDATARDPKLANLIETFKARSDFTFSRYRDAVELEQRIRDDVTATISERFVFVPEPLRYVGDRDSVLKALEYSGLTEVVRTHLLSEIERELVAGSVCVTGPLGSGKTVVLARLSQLRDYLFVSCANLSPKDSLAKCAALLRQKNSQSVRACFDVNAAIGELSDALSDSEPATLVVDDCDRPDLLLEAFNGADRRGEVQLCFSARAAPVAYSGASVPISPFQLDEIRAAAPAWSAEPEKLLNQSQGNPLYVRFFVASGGRYEESLAAYELKALQGLPPRVRELCTCAAISEEPLGIEDLNDLVGSEGGIEYTVDLIRHSQGFLVERSGKYQLFHDHLRQTIRRSLENDPPRRGFYGKRLANHFETRARYVAAFAALDFAQSGEVEALIPRAAFEARIQGDVHKGRHILERQIQLASASGDAQTHGQALVSLAQLLEVAGNIDESRTRLLAAAELGRSVDDNELLMFVEERLITLDARSASTQANVSRLIGIRDAALDCGDQWTAGRLSLELSALYIRNDEFRPAAREALKATELFVRIGDDYGASLGKRNLASAYTASSDPEDEKKGQAILAEFESRSAEMNLRERAWLLNLRARQARKERRSELAVTLSREAAAIGESLGDTGVVLVNTINVGNALRDLDQNEAALEAYVIAADRAAKVGDARSEANAGRFVAASYNALRRFVEARLAALKAVARATRANATYLAAKAGEELGDALLGLGERRKATAAYIEAAKAVASDSGQKELFWQLVTSGLAPLVEDEADDEYLAAIDELVVPAAERSARKPDSDSVDVSLSQAMHIARLCAPIWTVRAQSLHAKILFRKKTPLFSCRVAAVFAKLALDTKESRQTAHGRILSSAVYLSAAPVEFHSRHTLVALSEQLAQTVDGLHFRPSGDGAANWTLRLDTDPPVIMSIRQLDDRADTFLATWLISALLKVIEGGLGKAIISNPSLGQRELYIWVGNEGEIRAHVESASPILGDALPYSSAVSRPTAFSKDELAMTFVVCRGDISSVWSLASGPTNSLIVLMAQLIDEVAYQLYEGQIDLELIQPKIIGLLRRWLH